MPTNKRPRKPYRPKPVRYTCFDPAVVQTVLDDLTATEFGAYVSLQNGTATNDQSDPDSPPLIDLDRNTLMQLADYEPRPKAA